MSGLDYVIFWSLKFVKKLLFLCRNFGGLRLKLLRLDFLKSKTSPPVFTNSLRLTNEHKPLTMDEEGRSRSISKRKPHLGGHRFSCRKK